MTKSRKSTTKEKAGTASRSPASKTGQAANVNKSVRNRTNAGKQDHTIRPDTKLARLIELMRRNDGATIGQLADATGWQAHSVRGAISGTIKKKFGLSVMSEKVDGRGRVYRIAAER